MIPFINDPFAASFAQERQPIAAPLADPGAGQTATIHVNCEWLAIVQGVLRELLQEAVWNHDLPGNTQRGLGAAQTLITLFATAQQGDECTGVIPAIACAYDFTTSEEGYSPIVSGGVTYAVYDGGVGWHPGCTPCFGGSFFQLQCFKNIASAFLYTCTIAYSSTQELNIFDINNIDNSTVYPAGTNQLATFPVFATATVLRPIMTTLPTSDPGSDFVLHSAIYTMAAASCP